MKTRQFNKNKEKLIILCTGECVNVIHKTNCFLYTKSRIYNTSNIKNNIIMTTNFHNKEKAFIQQKKLDEFSYTIDDIMTKYQIKFENKMEDITSNFLMNFQHSLEQELISLIKKIYSHNSQKLNKYLIEQLLNPSSLQSLNQHEKDIIAKIFNKISFSILENLVF